MTSPTVSIVIPTLNAAAWLPTLFAAFKEQTPLVPQEIIIVDSGSTDATVALAAAEPMARVIPIQHFTHGGARNLGVREARGDIVVLMTQDATPANPRWLRALIAPLADKTVAAVYSRQIPRDDAPLTERFFLEDRFPDGDVVIRRHTGSASPSYPATFFSNVSAAARRDTWLRFPFDESLLMSEDQQFTRDVLLAGLGIAYAPASVVWHSHNYTLKQTFKRYFDSVYAFTQLSAQYGVADSARLARQTAARELQYVWQRRPLFVPYYLMQQVAKATGALAAQWAKRWPGTWCARCSLNPSWWKRPLS